MSSELGEGVDGLVRGGMPQDHGLSLQLPRREERRTDLKTRPIVLFDGVCNMCNGGVNFILDWDTEAQLRFSALQSDTGRALLQMCGRSPDDISSIVLVYESHCYLKSDAILRIARVCEAPLPALAAFGLAFPNLLRDGAYDVVAANRYSVFGKSDQCRLGDDTFADRFIA